MNLDAAVAQLLVGIATEFFAELRQNEFARMHEHDPKHFLFQIWIERKRVAQEIVDARDRFDAGKAAAGNDERQQRRTIRPRAFGVGFFEMRDQTIAQLNRVAERLHGQRPLGHAGQIEEVRDRPEPKNQMIVFERVRVPIESVRNRDALFAKSILSTSPQKKFTCRIILRTGLTMFVRSRSLAAISCSIGVNRKKFSRLTTVTSNCGSRRFSNSSAA